MKIISLILVTFMAMMLFACAAHPKTQIDPASVHLRDDFQDKGQGNHHTTHIDIAPPATMPAVAPPSAPTVLVSGSTAPTVTISGTAAATPISVDIQGRHISAPAGSAVSIQSDDTETPKETTHDSSADATGAGLHTDGDAGSFSAAAPVVALNGTSNVGAAGGESGGGGGNASGGASSAAWQSMVKAISAASSGELWCWCIGIGLILAAVAMIIFEHVFGGATDWPLVGLLAGSGLGFIILGLTAQTHPWILIVFGILAVVAIAGYVLYWKFGKTPAVAGVIGTVESDASAALRTIEAHLGIGAKPPTGGSTAPAATP